MRRWLLATLLLSGSALAEPWLVKGVVVAREASAVTVRHEAEIRLGMPAMTMRVRVSDPMLLETLAVGDTLLLALCDNPLLNSFGLLGPNVSI